MAQSRDRKILRIGISQNGKLVEERLLRKRDSVTIGASTRSTFVLPQLAAAGRSHILFELRAGVYHLCFNQAMTGKVSVESAVLDFQTLRTQNLAKKRGDLWVLPLSDQSRGKVVIDDVTLLFQFVTPPPPPSRLQLPASVRGGILHAIDWPFTNVLLGSAVLQVAAVLFITTRDYPEKPRGIDQLPDRFVNLLVERKDVPPPEVTKVDETKDKEGEQQPEVKKEPEVVKKAPEVKKEPVEAPVADSPEGRKVAEDKRVRKMTEKVVNRTILSQLGTNGGDGPGDLVNSLTNGASSVSMAEAFDGASAVAMANGGENARDTRRRVGGGSGETGQVAKLDKGALEAKGGGPVTSGKKAPEVAVKGKVEVKKPSEAFGTGVLSSAEIASVVKRRTGAVKACYERQLKRNPKLAGAVKIQFTIEQSGRVERASVLENTTGDAELGTCISGQIRSWRFRQPDGGSVTVAYPFVFAPAN